MFRVQPGIELLYPINYFSFFPFFKGPRDAGYCYVSVAHLLCNASER